MHAVLRMVLVTALTTSAVTLGYPAAIAVVTSLTGSADSARSELLADDDASPSSVRRVDAAVECSIAPAEVSTATAPGGASARGLIGGTTTADLRGFADTFNSIRVENCLQPFPAERIRYDECLEARLTWMAEDPSEDPASAWGHIGSVRSDDVPSTGCDGNLAGGSGNTGAIVAQKWWDSEAHRETLYRPEQSSPPEDVCIGFAMTHGGLPDEPASFTRAAAIWTEC